MASSSKGKGPRKGEIAKEESGNMKQAQVLGPGLDAESRVLAELEKMRAENRKGQEQIKASLAEIKSSMEELKGEVKSLDTRTTEVEDRVGEIEDNGMRYERALKYLLHRDMDLTARCEDLQNRLRRNNLRIYRVPEGSEGADTREFVKELLKSVIDPMPDGNLQIERAHRALTAKPKKADDPPRSIIVRFVDHSEKEAILRQAWKQQKILYGEEQIYFDHDYSPELQKKRTEVRKVIKSLKQKGIKAKCVFPAQLKILFDSGEKTFATITEALPTLKELNIHPKIDEREKMEREMARSTWKRTEEGGEKTKPMMTRADMHAFFAKDE